MQISTALNLPNPRLNFGTLGYAAQTSASYDFTTNVYSQNSGDLKLYKGFSDFITFSRTSNATVTDSDGLIKYAAHNLLANSESFDSTTYSKVNATVTANAAVAPNGTTTADKFIADATANQHRLRVTGVATTNSNICSIYAKAAEYDWIILQGGGSGYAYFDVNNGVVGTQVNTVGTIESVGDGWFRCSVALTGSTTILDIWVTTANGTTSFTGDGTSGVYIWGSQLINQPCVSNDYVSTSPANLLGFTEEFDNAAWTKSNSFVQTNLVTYSEQFDNAAWTKGNSSITANSDIAPNGTTTADRIIENTALTTHQVEQSVSVTSGVSYTYTVYAKVLSTTRNLVICFRTQFGTPWNDSFNLVTGTIVENQSGGASITAVGNGWYRCSVTRTAAATASAAFTIRLRDPSAPDVLTYTGDGSSGAIIWGAQIVQGSDAGEYTQTGASTAAVTYTDPFGVKYARKLVEDTAASAHFLQSATLTAQSGTAYTFSCYAKAGERSKFELLGFALGLTARGFDLSNGTTFTNTAGLSEPTSFSITPVGNGWYRCSITANGNGLVSTVRAYLNNGTTFSYTGDGTSGIYISGAQLSNSASLDPYIYNPTTAITSAARYMPRFNYEVTDTVSPSRINLLTYSEEFNQAAWTKSASTVSANAAVAPNGTTTADKFTEDSANTYHRLQSANQGIGKFTFSVYAKSAGRDWFILNFVNLPDGLVNFNLGTGTKGSQQSAVEDATITSVGNGWYRVTCTVTLTSTIQYAEFLLADGDSSIFYQGDGTSGVYVWGAQLEQGSTATDYIYSGATQGFVNAVMTTEAQGLLIEEQRTNLLQQSETFDNAYWTKARVSVSANTVVSPDGMQDADSLIEDTTASNTHLAFSSSVAVLTATIYTYTIYAKAAGRTWFNMQIGTGTEAYGAVVPFCYFNLSNGTLGTNNNCTPSITSVGNGWYRCVLVAVATTAATTTNMRIKLADSGPNDTYTGNGTSGIYIWGAQVEAGAFPTSYIPTVASTVTRNADNASILGRNFASWYNQSEGTVYADFSKSNNVNAGRIITLSNGTANNQIRINGSVSTNIRPDWQIVDNGNVQANITDSAQGAINTSIKSCGAYLINNFGFSTNATLGTTDISGTVPIISQANIGANEGAGSYLNGTIKSINYWPTRLTNAQLQAITS